MANLLDPDAIPPVLATMFATRHTHADLLAGVNDDDCAVIRWRAPLLVVSTDYVNASPIALEFGLGNESTVGRLAVAANLADLLGSGALPRCFLLSAVMARDSDVSAFMLLAEGAKMEAERWGVPVVGGDTKLGRAMAVCGTAIGEAGSAAELFLKYRARPGDDIWVSGQLGSCSAAVLGMSDNILEGDWRRWAGEVLTMPDLPLEKSRAVAALGLSCGGTDISDGLGTDLAQMCGASGVGAVIDVEEVPIHPYAAKVAADMSLPKWVMAFGVGGEFQFVVTAPPAASAVIAKAGLTRIGAVTTTQELLGRNTSGQSFRLPSGGHRDGRRLSFAAEVRQLVREASHACR